MTGIVYMIGFLGMVQHVQANNIQVSNVYLIGQNTSEGFWLVQFDLSWENSWRTDNLFPDDGHDVGNWDAAWIFVKYKVGDGDWQHAKLHSSGHSTGSGTPATLEIGVPNEREVFHSTANPGVGAFIYRSTNSTGTFSTTGNQLRWNYGVDGVADDADLDLRVFAIEMVYVAPGPFWLGSVGNEFGRFHAGGFSDTTPFQVTDSWNGCIENIDGCLWGTSPTENSSIGGVGSLDEHYPTGLDGFYRMKYSISQQQYVDFLNTLTPLQAGNRAYTDGEYRNGISFTGWQYETTNPNVANNFISWMDGAAYLDWAGLRPMTELEYEKAARGPATPIALEYAWGTSTINNTRYTLSNIGESDETIASNYHTTSGNAIYEFTHPIALEGPIRVGIFAAHNDNSGRVTSGAGYWGIMELSGNTWERPVTVGNSDGRNFTGLHGNGHLNTEGHGTIEAWPGSSVDGITGADGSGLRGSSWGSAIRFLQVSNREGATLAISIRQGGGGNRGLRSLPVAVGD